jgi:galactose-1-phosphate uridylyltransferase
VPFLSGQRIQDASGSVGVRSPRARAQHPGLVHAGGARTSFPRSKLKAIFTEAVKTCLTAWTGWAPTRSLLKQTITPQLEDLNENQVTDVLFSWRDRILDLKKDPRFEYILVFKNRGTAAGASLAHAHSQLIATPMVPIRVKQELRGSDEYYRKEGPLYFLQILRSEMEKKERVVEVTDDFAVITPFASRFPFEMWIMPRRHSSEFRDHFTDAQFRALSRTLKAC